MNILDTIYEKLSRLPHDSQKDVLRYIDAMEAKSGADNESGLDELWREIDEIVESVPEGAWDEVPKDGAANHDHYLYGAPKRY